MIQLPWVSGRTWIRGNEIADRLAELGSLLYRGTNALNRGLLSCGEAGNHRTDADTV